MLLLTSLPAHNKSSAVAEMGDPNSHKYMGRKVERGCCEGGLGSHLTQCGLGRDLPIYQVEYPYGLLLPRDAAMLARSWEL